MQGRITNLSDLSRPCPSRTGERGQQSTQAITDAAVTAAAATPLAAAALPASATPIPSWQTQLDTWVNHAATPEEQIQRQEVYRKIAEAYKNRRTQLDPTGSVVGVHLPAFFTTLCLKDYIGSLVGIHFPAFFTKLCLKDYTGSLVGVHFPDSLVALSLNGYTGSLVGIHFPDSLVTLSLNGYTGSLVGVNLPSALDLLSLRGYTGSLVGVTFSDSISVIDLTDYKGSLVDVIFPASLKKLYLDGYRGSLAGVHFPASLKTLLLEGYTGSLVDVIFPAFLKRLYLDGYRGSLVGVHFPASLNMLLLHDYTGPLEGVTFRSGVVQGIPEEELRARGAIITPSTRLEVAPPLTSTLSSLLRIRDFVPASYQALLQAPQAPILFAFLDRMVENFPSLSPKLRTYIEFANTNPNFRRFFFEEVETASTNCADRPLHMFARFSALASVYQAQEKRDTAGIVQGVLTMHLLNILDNYARDVYVTRTQVPVAAAAAASSEPVIQANEALEAALYLYLGLKSKLSLTIAIDPMQNWGLAERLLTGEGLTPQEHMARAEKLCLEAIATPELQHAILMQSPWVITEVENQHGAIIQAIKNRALHC